MFVPSPQGIQPYGVTAQNYGHVAKSYDLSRPDYPDDSIVELMTDLKLTSATTVLDLGAGTGKLTKALLKKLYPDIDFEEDAIFNFYAVEVSAAMRDQFTHQFPGVPIFPGLAENLRLSSESIDIVVVGTAFHWFKGRDSLAEIARVLKPEGKLGLIWNMMDPECSWVHELRSLLDPHGQNHDTVDWKRAFLDSTLFTNPLLNRKTFRYTISATAQEVINSLLTFKAAAAMTMPAKAQFIEKARSILQKVLIESKKSVIDLPYRVELYTCERVPSRKKGSHLDVSSVGRCVITRSPSELALARDHGSYHT